MKHLTHRKQAGDTIVEVLIAISIVSVVLVGAFAVANNSSNTVQDNQEHSQAQQFLQTQVESLRGYVQTHSRTEVDTALAALPAKMCVGGGGVPTAYGSCAALTVGGATNVMPSFTRSGDDYTFVIEWDSIKGGTAKETLVYRVYPKS